MSIFVCFFFWSQLSRFVIVLLTPLLLKYKFLFIETYMFIGIFYGFTLVMWQFFIGCFSIIMMNPQCKKIITNKKYPTHQKWLLECVQYIRQNHISNFEIWLKCTFQSNYPVNIIYTFFLYFLIFYSYSFLFSRKYLLYSYSNIIMILDVYRVYGKA